MSTLQLQLIKEEIWFLSVLLKIDDLPGINFDFLQNIAKEQFQVWLDVIRERLIKRNILIFNPDNQEYTLDDGVALIFDTWQKAEKILILQYLSKKTVLFFQFYKKTDFSFYLTMVNENSYEFVPVLTDEYQTEIFTKIINDLPEVQFEKPTFEIDTRLFIKIQELVTQDKKAIKPLLIENALEADVVEAMEKVFSDPYVTFLLQTISPPIKYAPVTLLADVHSAFVFSAETNPTSTLKVQVLKKESLTELLWQILQDYQRTEEKVAQ